MEYMQAGSYEAHGSAGSLGVKILVSAEREISRDEQFAISRKAEEVFKAIAAESIRLDPRKAESAKLERKAILSLFPGSIFAEEIPNGYCSDWCCKHLPWFVVTTPLGRIKIGWRKRVGEPARFTPGPWSVACDGEVVSLSSPSPVGNHFRVVAWHANDHIRIEKADAHLISAAPDLLAALKRMTIAFTHDSACAYYDGPIDESLCNCARKDAMAAIRKAESR